MSTTARRQLAEAIDDALIEYDINAAEAAEAIMTALTARPRALREFADQQGQPPLPERWTATEVDPARWLRGACSSGDPLYPALQAAVDELALLRAGASPDDTPTTDEVYGWHRARFGEPDVALVALKLAEETGEVAADVVKRAEGAVRPEKGLMTREDWTRHLLGEIGDVGIVLHVLCGREGVTLDEAIGLRFRGDVAHRVAQEVTR